MDIQQILALNVMVISALAAAMTLIQGSWRTTRLWLAVNLLIVVAGIALLQWSPAHAGTIVTLLFVPLVLAPAILTRMTQTRINQHRLSEAANLARIATWFHPSAQARLNAQMIAAQAAGSLDLQVAAMRRVQADALPEDKPVIEATILRTQGKWEALLDHLQSHPELASGMAGLTVRALGETGQLDRMTRAYDDAKSRLHALDLAVTQLIMLAFAGRSRAVEQLLSGPLSTLDADSRSYWTAIADRAAGTPAESWRPALERLATASELESVRVAASRQLDAPHGTGPARLDDLSTVIIDDCAARVSRDDGAASRPTAITPITWALLAAIASGYVLEEISGGSQNLRTLVDLGALWPPYVTVRGEWWRLVTALFLHFGPLHAGVNALMLWVLGRSCERTFGSLRMAVIYGIGGIASTAFVLWLAASGNSEPSVLVGASGAIMALFGAMAGRSVIVWLRHRDVLDGRNLVTIAVIVALQVAVDLSVPQVSLAAHASGLVAGAVLGAIITMIGRRRNS